MEEVEGEVFGAKLCEKSKKSVHDFEESGEYKSEYENKYRKLKDEAGEEFDGALELWENLERGRYENVFLKDRTMGENEKNDAFYRVYEKEIVFDKKRIYDKKGEREDFVARGIDFLIGGDEKKEEERSIFYSEEALMGDGGKVERGLREKVLNTVTQKYAEALGNVKIEVTNNNTIERESDIDEISYRLTEKLCEMMARGTDGLY